MKPKRVKKLSAEYVRSILDYDSETGIFLWKKRDDRRPCWNSRFAGKSAGGKLEIITSKTSYIVIGIDGAVYLAHRLSWLYIYGEWPKADIDHVDLDGTNNRISNLREATRSQNIANSGMLSSNTSGWKGVSYEKPKRKWKAYIRINGLKINLGRYNCPTAAHLAYCHAANKHFGEFARTE